jgi:hypothetical protein
MKDPQAGAPADLTARILEQLGDASVAEAHGAILRAAFASFDRMLLEAAAVGELERVQPWLRGQLDAIYFYVVAWQPGASAAGSALEALEGRASERPQ